jgi:hypothetical protein
MDPLTFIGDSYWTSFSMSTTAMVNKSAATDAAAAGSADAHPTSVVDGLSVGRSEGGHERSSLGDAPKPYWPNHFVRLCGGCGSDPSKRGILYGCPAGCCFNITSTGYWEVGDIKHGGLSGKIAGFKDEWHKLGLAVAKDGSVTATVDGTTVAHTGAGETPNTHNSSLSLLSILLWVRIGFRFKLAFGSNRLSVRTGFR